MKNAIIIIVAIILGGSAVYFIATRASQPQQNGVGAGERGILNGTDNATNTMQEMTLTSSAFAPGDSIPSKYTCDGESINPPLRFGSIPKDAVSLALIVDDPDIPDVVKTSRGIDKFDHWVIFNLPATLEELPENFSGEGVVGANSAGDAAYTGPCPPPDYEPTQHRYVFQLYALDTELPLKEGATEQDVRNAMKGHILGKAELIGVYDRAN